MTADILTGRHSLDKETNHKYYRYVGALVNPEQINVLSQPRKTFEEIEPLAENIAGHGLIHPLLVACFSKESCEQYLETLNSIWQTNHQTSTLTCTVEKGKETFYVLIAGERRFRAHQYLIETGCETCHEIYGPGGCFERHFPTQKVEARLCVDILPEDALDLQFTENTHMRVPPYEEARAYHNYFQYKRKFDPNYPVSRFARKVGRTPETIRKALKFCELPHQIQEYVERGYVTYGIACEITRLQSLKDLNEEDLKWWAMRAIAKNYKTDEFRQLVNEYLFTRNSGQTMLEIFTSEQEKETRRLYFKKVVAKELVMSIWTGIHYFRRINELFLEGQLGKEDSPYSMGSPVRAFQALVQQQEKLLPHLRGLLSPEEYKRAEKTLPATGQLLSFLRNEADEVVDAIRLLS